ncbi:uncharacterized protein LOC121391939 [Gigantopelta aegis]|uniref:uncharacterized protein LOC121391939 n=1 Tax=Gigantopelta aegis TaxID=1735272 RepID=UPI001B88960A|nr:uncharacterized protein LOC121391939 [Gigantopelta aegis]
MAVVDESVSSYEGKRHFCWYFLDKSLIQFCFMQFIQDELDAVVQVWNTHLIRRSQYQSIRSSLYRERRKKYPAMPSTRGEVTLDGGLTTTVQGERFLFGEDGDGDEKIIAFASNVGLQKLSIAKTFYVDGTFGSAPRIFYQIISIHVFVMGVMMPLVFGFLPNKSTSTYVRFLTLVKNNAAALGFIVQPLRVMMDFELGLMNAHSTVFPGVQVKVCYFHYSWRLKY